MLWLSALVLLWLVVGALMLRARQLGSVRLTRRWTTRLYAVSLVPLTALVAETALVVVQLVFVRGIDSGEAIARARPYAMGLAPLINLVLLDMALRRSSEDGHRERQLARAVHADPMPTRPQAVARGALPRTVPHR